MDALGLTSLLLATPSGPEPFPQFKHASSRARLSTSAQAASLGPACPPHRGPEGGRPGGSLPCFPGAPLTGSLRSSAVRAPVKGAFWGHSLVMGTSQLASQRSLED